MNQQILETENRRCTHVCQTDNSETKQDRVKTTDLGYCDIVLSAISTSVVKTCCKDFVRGHGQV
jgi:hypothetical protein